MKNAVLEEYLARVRDALDALPNEERDAVIAETRAHLEEAIAARMADAPGADLARITLDEAHAFGDPAEIAAARAPLRVTSPVRAAKSRAWARALWGLLVAAGVVLAIGITIDLTETGPPLSLYARDNVFANQTGEVNDTFVVPLSVEVLTLTLRVDDRGGGCAGVRVTDPQGSVVLDEWDACGGVLHKIEIEGRSGEWGVEIRYRDFTGTLSVTARERCC